MRLINCGLDGTLMQLAILGIKGSSLSQRKIKVQFNAYTPKVEITENGCPMGSFNADYIQYHDEYFQGTYLENQREKSYYRRPNISIRG